MIINNHVDFDGFTQANDVDVRFFVWNKKKHLMLRYHRLFPIWTWIWLLYDCLHRTNKLLYKYIRVTSVISLDTHVSVCFCAAIRIHFINLFICFYLSMINNAYIIMMVVIWISWIMKKRYVNNEIYVCSKKNNEQKKNKKQQQYITLEQFLRVYEYI